MPYAPTRRAADVATTQHHNALFVAATQHGLTKTVNHTGTNRNTTPNTTTT